jgi:hypothetical protein
MRFLALAMLWLLLIVAVLTTLAFGAVIFFGEDGEARLGGVMISGMALAIVFGLRAGIRGLRRPAEPPLGVAVRAADIKAGEPASPSLNPRDYGLPE